MSRNQAGGILLVFLVVVVWMLAGCEIAINEPSTGRVVGKAVFLNNDSHEDIIVSLEILEKGKTRNVSRAINGITSDADSRSLTAQTKTKANGEFSFESVPEGSYTLYASSKDSKERAVYTSLQVVKGETVTAPDLQLTAVGDIKGKIAVWIKYDGNQGDSGTVPDMEFLYAGDSTTIQSNIGNLTRAGYIFSGWNTEADGDGADYTIGSSLILEESRTLYAKWIVTVGGPGQAGGIIFYDDESDGIDTIPGYRYLEAAPTDWNDMDEYTTIFGYYRTTWDGVDLPVGTITNVGAGMSNTIEIVQKMGDILFTDPSGTSTKTSSYAAKICNDFALENEGVTYDDWFLPSREELALMYLNLKQHNLGGFSDANYWSSTEKNALYAAFFDFNSGNNYDGNRSSDFRIRPIRAY
nr:InlB B-repeat-containing protein [uncultured Sphaerochaeta sp.]